MQRPQPTSIELYVRTYEQALAREAPDRDWQRHVAGALEALLASAELAGAQLQAQRCGTTLCRVDLRYDSLRARERAEEALPQREPFDSEGLIHSSRDGLQVSVYFSRRGYPLPEVEPPSAAL